MCIYTGWILGSFGGIGLGLGCENWWNWVTGPGNSINLLYLLLKDGPHPVYHGLLRNRETHRTDQNNRGFARFPMVRSPEAISDE